MGLLEFLQWSIMCYNLRNLDSFRNGIVQKEQFYYSNVNYMKLALIILWLK